MERPITPADAARPADSDLRFVTAVAGFAQALRGGRYLKNWNYQDIARLAASATGDDARGLRREFVNLVERAEALTPGRGEVAVITPGRS